MPTIGAFMQLLPAGFRGAPYRQTDATIYVVVEGHGPHAHRRHDVTSGARATSSSRRRGRRSSHEAQEDAVLFSMSDRPAQQALGLWREQVPAT